MEELRDKAHSLPRLSGVYLMQDKDKKVIYVGKAKSLRNRVSQYFQESASHSLKTRVMVGQISSFDVIVVGTEFEALVLESSLIKRHQPKYNILLKDSKGYPYIRLSVGEKYPRFSLVAKVGDEKPVQARYFGPYGSRHNTQSIVEALQMALALPQCSRKFPRDIGKERPCLHYHMKNCLGHCRHQTGIEAHQEGITQAVSLLEGKYQEVEEALRLQMEEAAENLRFEQAGELRDRLRAITLLGTKQKVVASSLSDTDVVGFVRGVNKSAFVVLHYLNGELWEKECELIPNPLEEEGDSIFSLLREYYGVRSSIPRQILLPCEIEFQDPLARLFSDQSGHKVEILNPQRGGKVEIIRLAEENAREEVERITTKEEREHKNLSLLGKLLGMETAPLRIESYDISNTQGSHIVASMVVFVEGRGKKSDYRKFKLRDMTGPDDYASMEQVLRRRFQRYLDGDLAFGAFPDMLLIDGGLEHVRVAQRVLDEMALSCPAFGMVKDNRHRTRALVSPLGHEIGIVQHPSLFAFIGQIQEETHRVAIQFHRQLQSKDMYGSVLDQIEGVGKTRKAALLRQFKSMKALHRATVEELAQVVPQSVAQKVYDFFKEQEKEKCVSSQEQQEESD